MARKLRLKTERLQNGKVMVSWMDVYPSLLPLLVRIPLAAIFLYCVIAFMFTLDPNYLWFPLIILAISIYLMINTPQTKNSVIFKSDVVQHRGKKFPTRDITRFEYGSQSELTGNAPKEGFDGEKEIDPFIIRIWLNDSISHDISKNVWQKQINHEIRDALDNALRDVRGAAVKHERAEKFGQQDDFDLPDY